MIAIMTAEEQKEAAELMKELEARLCGRNFVLVVDAWTDGESGDIHSNVSNRKELLGLLEAALEDLKSS